MLFFLFLLLLMTDSQAKSYQREQKFLSEHPTNIMSEKDTHPKYKSSKYIKEVTALTDTENPIIINEIAQAGSPEEYVKAVVCLEPEDPRFQKALQDVEKAKKLYEKQSPNPENLNAKMPEKTTCGILMQSINSGACNLYSFLGAALNVDPFRKKLKKLIVNEDQNNVYVKFPYLGPSNAGQDFKKTFDTVYKVSKEIYSSTVGTLLPSENFWVQAISRAFYEHLNALGAASLDSYNLTWVLENNQTHELFFGTKVETFNIYGPCIINESSQKEDPCQESLILKKNGTIEIKDTSSVKELDGTNKILIVPTKNHARTLYYDKDSKKWKLFDNQDGQRGQCGLPVEDDRTSLDYTAQVQIISLPK